MTWCRNAVRSWMAAGTQRSDPAEADLARLINGYLLAVCVVLFAYTVWYVWIDWSAIAILNSVMLPAIIGMCVVVRSNLRLAPWANAFPAVGLGYFVMSSSITEHASNPSIWWLVFVPVLAANLLGLRATLWWTLAAVGGVFFVEALWASGVDLQLMARNGAEIRIAMTLTLPTMLLAFSLTARRAQDRQAAALRAGQQTLAAQAEALAAARDQAVAASRTKREFLANTSHEIRTPLNGILGMADILAVETDASANAAPVARIRAAGEDLLATVDDILDCSKLQAGKVVPEAIRVEWAELAARAQARSRAAAVAAGVRVRFEIDCAAGAAPLTDPTWLGRAIGALVDNAVRYSEGAVDGEVVLAMWRDGDRVVVEVSDSGPGFGAIAPESLVEAFAQGEAPPGGCRHGIGLGLTIADAVARVLGGRLSFRSGAEGRGCVARLEVVAPAAPALALPVDVVAPAVAAPDVVSPSGPAGRVLPPTPLAPDAVVVTESVVPEWGAPPADGADDVSVIPGMRVLLAEDNPVNVKVAQARLASFACEVTVVGDGEAALAALAHESFDIVLMDVHMPVLDGCEATRRLRASERESGGLSHTIVVAMTAETDRAELERCRLAGMDDELSKPFKSGDLAALLQRWQPLEAG